MSKKQNQLGMSTGKARSILVKKLMFNMLCRLDLNQCFVCKKEMLLENFSIEHKMPWLDSEMPGELYFDLDNITFSHLSCNSSITCRNGKCSGATFNRTRRGNKKWKCTINSNGKTKHVGWFLTAEEATEAYNKVAHALGKLTSQEMSLRRSMG